MERKKWLGNPHARTVDIDVIVLAMTAFHSLCLSEFRISFGTKMTLNLYDAIRELDSDTIGVLSLLHALPGCNTTSQYSSSSKKQLEKFGIDFYN